MLVTIVALHHHDLLFGDYYNETVERWLEKAKNEWIHPNTGLLFSQTSSRTDDRPPRGSYSALSTYYLTLTDPDFALQQYRSMMDTFAQEEPVAGKTVFGIKEYLRKSPQMTLDMDAGPIVSGFSPSGTAWAIGSATYFEDWETRSRLLRTGEMAGGTIKRHGKQHYRLADFALVGEAVVLAMRTNRKS